jgi:hypothetical protein
MWIKEEQTRKKKDIKAKTKMKTRRGARNSSFPLPLLLHNGGAVFQC